MLMQVLMEDARANPGLVRFAKMMQLIWAFLLLVHGVWLVTRGAESGAFIGHTADGWVKIIGVFVCLLVIWRRRHSLRFTILELMLVTFASQLAREWLGYTRTDGIHHGDNLGLMLAGTVVLLGGVIANALQRTEMKGRA